MHTTKRITGRKVVFILILCLLTVAAAVVGCRSMRAEHVRLPVLMYHHFAAESDLGTVVSEARFREQMAALREAGFVSVTVSQVAEHVEKGTPLPEKPVLITMDDGYTSNIDIAAPILEEYGFCATVFVIGINEGEPLYVHSGQPLLPARFAFEEAKPWVEKGVLELQTHTYDMHQLASYGYSGREGILPLEGESWDDYAAALRADLAAFAARWEDHGMGEAPIAMAYPFGYRTDEAEAILREQGIRVTFTVEEHSNLLVVGDSASLWDMGRYNVYDDYTGETLVAILEG